MCAEEPDLSAGERRGERGSWSQAEPGSRSNSGRSALSSPARPPRQLAYLPLSFNPPSASSLPAGMDPWGRPLLAGSWRHRRQAHRIQPLLLPLCSLIPPMARRRRRARKAELGRRWKGGGCKQGEGTVGGKEERSREIGRAHV